MKPADRLTGYSLLLMVILALTASFGLTALAALAGCFAWLAATRLFWRLTRLQKIQVLVMLLIGLAGLLWGQWHATGVRWWWQALEANQGLLSMLVSVSFLRLVAVTDLAAKEALPVGRKALWKTLLGVHAFGAVINFSAMIIMADRLSARQQLTPLQALVISRGFTLAAHWSPFFAAMGVVLISAPGASLWTLMPVGLALAAVGLLLAGWWLLQQPEAAQTPAYPMHWKALLLPLLLAISVLTAHSLWEAVPVLTLVSLLSLVFTLVLLAWRYRRKGWLRLQQHIEHTLPTMSGETLLFLAAGVLAAGVGSALQAADFSLQLAHFGPWQAWLLLLVLVGVSGLGVHPVISIAIAGGLFAPWVSDPNLLALVFLMTWALGVTLSPLSGTHLAMQGRYGLPSYAFTRWNAGYVLLLLLVQFMALQLYGFFT
ncbi:hypothetical protein [Marinospirillum alkaliphilum]|uniref:Uncharacterized protein n=1 Tax=Marinospirillum alkaliphilum DSM 21637 TaxID=1122209 RepID=A0A1K1X6G3_9GAMM|nr:hypothetical protein [Marinospirillum alkaliphilum]SFX45289.1 hypothetical protein SAMN02745752_01745 [Marinospirillum alkaliphilum DSM 21637]